VVNRFMALRAGERELVRARRIAMSWAVVVYAGMLVLGWSGRVLFPGLADAEVVFVTAANELYPPLVSGVMIAAVLSAIMSTADSQLLVAASAVTWDLPRVRTSGPALLRGSRRVVLALSAAAALAALYGPQEIFSPVLVAFAALGAAFGPLLLVTVLRGPVSPRRSLMAMSSGLALTVAGALYRSQAGTAWGAAAERVLPFAVALAIALWPGGEDAPARATPEVRGWRRGGVRWAMIPVEFPSSEEPPGRSGPRPTVRLSGLRRCEMTSWGR
jgi:sodium/proline symporter